VSKGAVSQWLKRAREGGIETLRHRKPPGAPPRLTWEQKTRLPQLLAQGAQSFGFQGDLWTQPRVAEVVRREFGVSYDPSQVGRILKQCGLSLQKPLRRATQRDESAIQRWKEERWPVLKKGDSRAADHRVGGRIGVLSLACGGEHLGSCRKDPYPAAQAFSGAFLGHQRHYSGGRLYLMMKERSFKGPDVVQFLKGLLEEIPGKVMVIWDGAPIHRCNAVKAFLTQGAAARLRLEPLPAYAPELNPDEGIWRYLKRVELRNVCCQDLLHLLVELTMAAKRLLSKPDVIQACLRQVGYV
jgi:transposase